MTTRLTLTASAEAKHPSEIDDETDLPEPIQQALPDGGEQEFIEFLHQAMEDYPDEGEGEWWARAWDKINDRYEKDYDDAGAAWELEEPESRDEPEDRGETESVDPRRETDVDRRIDRFLSEGS